MWFKISNDDYIQWDKVEAVSFKRCDGLLIGALMVIGRNHFEATGDYAIAVWEKMFPTKTPHDIL